MLRVRTEDLRLGMFVQSLEGSWFDHSFWKTKFLLEESDDLRALQNSGVESVWIDEAQSLAPALAHLGGAAPPPRPSLAAEFAAMNDVLNSQGYTQAAWPPEARWPSDSPTQTMVTRPAFKAAIALARTISSVSPWSARRSLWPQMTSFAPASLIIPTETQPVWAPLSAAWQS